MLKIVEAKTFYAVTEGVINNLKKRLNEKNVRHIVLVPEQFTLSGEKIIFDLLGKNGVDNLDVTSLSRLAKKSVKNRNKILSPAGSLMLFTKAVMRKKDELQKYANSRRYTGFYREMYSVISALRNSRVSANSLLSLDLPQNSKLKMHDIAVLYEEYVNLLENEYNDATSLLEKFNEQISDSGEFTDCYFYVLNYHFFSKLQLTTIEKLLKISKGVMVGLPMSDGANSRIFPVNTFAELTKVAKNVGVKYEVEVAPTDIDKDFERIVDNVFGYEKIDKTTTEKVQLYANDNIEKEVEFAAQKIKYQVMHGERYRDFSVVVSSVNEYTPVIKKIFSRYDVPFFINKKEEALGQASIRYVLDAIKARQSGYEKGYMLKLALNPFSEITESEYDDFDSYILKYGINFSRFEKEFSLGKDDVLYKNAEKVREKIVKSLSVFKGEDYCGEIREFLDNADFIENTNKFMDKQVESGNSFYLPITHQAYDKLYSVLDEYDEILGSEKVPLGEFVQTLENMLSDINIGLVPVYVDSVYVGESDETNYEKVNNVIILGANQGQLPYQQKDAVILTSVETDMMKENGIVVYPTPKTNNSDALFKTLQLLVIANKKLIISYNESLGTAPSDIFRELTNIFDIGVKRYSFDVMQNMLAMDEEEFLDVAPSMIATGENAIRLLVKSEPTCFYRYNELLGSIYEVLSSEEKAKLKDYEKHEKEYKIACGDKLFFRRDFTSVSQIECYYRCPYMHFMDYGLNLKDRKEADFTGMDIGVIIHSVLENFFKDREKYDLTDTEIETIVNKIIDEILSSDQRIQAITEKSSVAILNRIRKECVVVCKYLVDRLKYTKFRPYKFEYAFGSNGVNPIEINAKDKTIKFIGKIDRIDKYEDRVIIIDYKTGHVDVSGFESVYLGKKIQLFTYLAALIKQNPTLKPAGVYYQPILFKYELESPLTDRIKCIGNTNASKQVVEMVDYTALEGKSTLIGGLETNKDGSFSKKAEKIMLSDEEFEKVCKYVNTLVQNACEQIIDGNILASPINGACNYCSYKNVCGFDKEQGRKVSEITKETIIEAIDEC